MSEPTARTAPNTGEYPIRRPYRAAPTPTKEGPRSNRDIRGVREVQLIDDTGANRGVVSFFDALKIAEDAGLDLLLLQMSPQAEEMERFAVQVMGTA